jgi:hypothetical protein
MNELEKAIALIKASGFAVIKRENVRQLEALKHVQDATILKLGNVEGFVNEIRKDLYHSLVSVLNTDGICELSKAPNESVRYCTTYRARLTVIPHEIDTDPFLELMRKEQRS